jgi:SecD/SecF fusion protein
MRILIRNLTICFAVIVLSLWAINPPGKKLRLGRDLGGGTSLVYTVQLGPQDGNIIPRIIEVLKERVDPKGLSEVQFVQRGRDRIEITMPAPTPAVDRLKKAYEAELAKLSAFEIDAGGFERLMRMEGEARDAEIARVSGTDASRLALIKAASAAFEAAKAARAQVEPVVNELKAAQTVLGAAQAELKTATDAKRDPAVLTELQKKVTDAQAAVDAVQTRLDDLAGKAAGAEEAYDQARDKARGSGLSAQEMRRALALSREVRTLRDEETRKVERLPSPRETTLKRLREQHPESADQMDRIIRAYDEYAAERRGLDDPADLKRLISNAGVLSFRITVGPGEHQDEARLRQELRERGPKSVRSNDARWYKINRIENWYDSAQDLALLLQDPAAYFQLRQHYVVEMYDGEYFMLAWDTPGSRLTRADGEWGVKSAYIGPDRLGRNAIKFEMDPRGGVKLGDLTKNNVGKPMAVLLDDEVYTAPNLQDRISTSGEITGNFSDPELNYIVRVLSAGSLQAKLSPDPISENTLGPELGADNLNKGLRTAQITFGVVTVFMIIYYFSCGGIAVLALAINFLLVLAIMSLNRAAFTLPGIAGIVLTFGQAIDANVLIYERMREEFLRGADMKTAVRLGFSRAASSIIDGNVANLIICIVLFYFGTTEIRGFAITLGIGVVTTLFTAVFVSRVIFTLLVDHVGWRQASQLPMKFPFVQRLMTPHVDWMRWRWVFLGALAAFLAFSAVISVQRGSKLLDTEFLGGTQVELTFRKNADGTPTLRARPEVEEMVRSIGKEAPQDSQLRVLDEAEVLPVNPQPDGVTSDRFKITVVNRGEASASNDKPILAALTAKFQDLIESRPALEFAGREATDWRRGPVYRVLSSKLGEDIELTSSTVKKSDVTDDVTRYIGGLAIVLENIQPPTTKASIVSRLDTVRQQADFSDTLGRAKEVRVIEGTDEAVKTAVVLVRDDSLKSFDNEAKWSEEVAAREWRLVVDSLTQPSQLARVDTVSPTIASTFQAQAIVSVVMSLVMLTIYVWIRFGTGRWALAATVPLFADVIGIIGLIAIAQILYENPSTHTLAVGMKLLPFKMDLNMIAALLTITGYSLNDKIIILDRIRENKGKLPYASYKVINDSINQTLSRTFITAGTTLFSTVVLYFYGGEGIRGFAYAFTLGVFIGTYTSIVSSPLVWSRKADKKAAERPMPPAPAIPPGPSAVAGTPAA